MISNENLVAKLAFQIENGIMINANACVENIIREKKFIVGILAHVFFENGKELTSTADTSVIVCDEIINATDSVSENVAKSIPTNVINTISTNVAVTMSITSDIKKSNISNRLLHFASIFISVHISIHNLYCLLLLYKT